MVGCTSLIPRHAVSSRNRIHAALRDAFPRQEGTRAPGCTDSLEKFRGNAGQAVRDAGEGLALLDPSARKSIREDAPHCRHK